MTTHARSTFEVKSWDEHTLSEIDGRVRITRASVVFAYHGDLEGEGNVEYLMTYGENGSAAVIAMERVTGSLAGKAGTFVLQHQGGYANGTARGAFTIVEGSGTGALASVHGSGVSVAQHEGPMTFALDYDLDGTA